MQEDAAARAVAVPIVYGSLAFWLGKKPPTSTAAAPEHTHKWTVFLRHPDGRDLSYAFRSVEIMLHPSFPKPVHEFTAPPYAVSETGWGEFDITFRIHLRDAAAEPITLTHKLALYPPSGQYNEKPVLSEHYDEVVFNSLPADAAVRAALLKGPQRLSPAYPYHELLPTYSAEDDMARIQAARQKLQDLKVEIQDRLMRARIEAEREKDELRALGAV